ncbi:porin [Bibersteinia trehalosi]|uniref:porin n=1 Tax=Bibersteinia trehalosi TaxID=47735 RepID=UPI002D78E1D0|nr:porin [Bibersteinia trehalosi]
MTKFTKTVFASLVTFTAAGANAAAFQLAEVSTSGLGLAYAGNAAVADNASVVATNPALMTLFKQAQVSAGAIYVNVDSDVEGTTVFGNNSDHKNVIPVATIPTVYFVAPVTDRFVIGGGLNVNYGLKSDFNDQYSAGIFGGNTELTATNYNLSAAYKLGYGLSIGAGANVVHAKAKLNRYAGDVSALYAQYGIQRNTVLSHMKGEEWEFGWNAGLMYEINENNRLGFAYHSPVKIKFNGKYSNQIPSVFTALGGTGGAEIDARLNLELPAFWEISGYHKLTDKFAVQYSYKRTDWSSFKELRATANDVDRFHKEENFSDASRIALGASYDLTNALTLRAGIAFDESASVNAPSISIPDADRTWYAVGATYRFTPDLSIDAAYAHVRGSRVSFTESHRVASSTYSGKYISKSVANVYGLNLNYNF